MIIGDKKKDLLAIMGPLKSKEDAPSESLLKAIAQEMIDAMKNGDAGGLESALRAAVAECGSESSMQGPDLE